jgi:hypothetical protein
MEGYKIRRYINGKEKNFYNNYTNNGLTKEIKPVKADLIEVLAEAYNLNKKKKKNNIYIKSQHPKHLLSNV